MSETPIEAAEEAVDDGSTDGPVFPDIDQLYPKQDKAADKPADKAEDKPAEGTDEAAPEDAAAKERAAASAAHRARQARREAEKAELDSLRNEMREIRAALRGDNGPAAPAEAPKPPNPRDFDFGVDDDKYIAAQHAYLSARDAYILEQAESKFTERYQNLQKEQLEAQRTSKLEARILDIEKKGLDKYPDFVEVVEDALGAMPPAAEALQALALQDGAEEVVYHLAKNPQVLQRLTGLDPMAQALELGRLASQFAARRDAVRTPITKAQATPSHPRGANGQFKSSEDALYDRLLNSKGRM